MLLRKDSLEWKEGHFHRRKAGPEGRVTRTEPIAEGTTLTVHFPRLGSAWSDTLPSQGQNAPPDQETELPGLDTKVAKLATRHPALSPVTALGAGAVVGGGKPSYWISSQSWGGTLVEGRRVTPRHPDSKLSIATTGSESQSQCWS